MWSRRASGLATELPHRKHRTGPPRSVGIAVSVEPTWAVLRWRANSASSKRLRQMGQGFSTGR